MTLTGLFALLDDAAIRFGDRPALFRGTAQVATFAQLRARALALAGGLRDVSGAGGKVLIAAKNCPEMVEIMFAAWGAGLAVVPVNAKLHAREIADIVADCAPEWIFASPVIARELATAGLSGSARIVAIGGDDYHALFTGEAAAPASVADGDLAWLFYTSGTTGRSKGAMLTHANLLAMARAHWTDIDDPAPGSALLHAAPLSHGSGLYLLPYIGRGACQVVPASGQFDPGETMDLCEAHPGTAMFLAPTMVNRLRDHVDESGRDPSALRLIVYGGGPMYVADIKSAMAVFGPKFAQIYGQGETPMTITGLSAADHVGASDEVLGSVGQARSDMDVRVVDGAGTPLPVGEAGEIVCRGPTVMAGYLGMAEASEAALRDGWLWTGDIGAFDADGYLTLIDRSKDVIISGGSNIYPREVEEVLLRHDGVAEASVVGEADPEWGEIVIAHVAPVSGAVLDPAVLDAHCLDHMARFKRPKRYVLHDSLPKNANGKVLKRELRSA